MPSITLNDIPEELLFRLQTAAEREHRSLGEEALVLIEGGLVARETAEEQALRQTMDWRDLAGGWVSDMAFHEEIAMLYAARTAGRNISL